MGKWVLYTQSNYVHPKPTHLPPLHVTLELHNVRMESLSVKKVRESPNATKGLSYVMLESHSVRMKSSNVRKKKGTIKCEKKTVICDVGTAQCEDGTVKCEKKVREPPNVRKNCHM